MIWLVLALCHENKDSLTVRLDSLFSRASRWTVGAEVDTARAARDSLVGMGDVALDYIFKYHMNTVSGLELRASEAVLRGLLLEARPRLQEAFSHENDTIRANAFYLAGKIKDTVLADTAAALLETEKEAGVRRRILWCLGEMGLARSAGVIVPYLRDTSARTRLVAVAALGKIKGHEEELAAALGDEDPLVREAAGVGLEGAGQGALEPLLEALSRSRGKERVEAVRALGLWLRKAKLPQEDTLRARRALFPFLDSGDARVRAWGVWALSPIADEGTRTKFLLMSQTEDDPLVLWCLEEALR